MGQPNDSTMPFEPNEDGGGDPASDSFSGSSSTVPIAQTYELLLQAQQGDADALNRLCERYLPRLHRLATHRLPPAARGAIETMDITQDILLKAIRRLGDLDIENSGDFHAYLRSAIVRRMCDEARKVRRRGETVEIEGNVEADDVSPLRRAMGRDSMDRYEAALARLRPQDQIAIQTRMELELSYEEVAEALGKTSPEAARKAVGRALAALKREWTRLGGDAAGPASA